MTSGIRCPYGCARELARGLDDSYHCPVCMRAVTLDIVAHDQFRAGAVWALDALRDWLIADGDYGAGAKESVTELRRRIEAKEVPWPT